MPDSQSGIFQNSRGERFEFHAWGTEDGYPILYMHGAVPMPVSRDLAETAREHNVRLTAVLRPGYGASSRLKYKNVLEYALTLEELIASLGLRRFDVLGLSAGAPYCYALAAAYPGLVDGVSICAGIPLANRGEIYRMYARRDRFMFFLSRHLPAGLIGRYGVRAVEATERKKGWRDMESGERMDDVFRQYVWPNWAGFGQSTRVQYRNWGFPAEAIPNRISIYHSRADEMIPIEIARASAGLLANGDFFEYEAEAHASERLLKDAVIAIALRAAAVPTKTEKA